MKYHGFIWAGIMVQDLESCVAFYRDILGLPLLGQGDEWAHLDAGNGTLLELFSGGAASPGPKPADRQSLILGLRVDDLDQARTELQARGVRFIGEVGEYARTRWAHFSDPEGNRLEIKQM